MRGRYCLGGAMAPFDGLLLKPVLAACFCGRWRTCMGRTAADHRRRGFKRRTASRAARSGAEQYASGSVRLRLEIRRTLDDRFQLAKRRSLRSLARRSRPYELPQWSRGCCRLLVCLRAASPRSQVSRRSLFSGPLGYTCFRRLLVPADSKRLRRGGQRRQHQWRTNHAASALTAGRQPHKSIITYGNRLSV